MLDRSVAPKISFDPSIAPIPYKTTVLNNSIPVYSISDHGQNVVGIQIIFRGGKIEESSRGSAYFSTHLLKSGTSRFDVNYINEFFELRGAFVQVQNGLDNNSFSLYCLSDKLNETLPFFLHLFKESNFPQTQLEKLKKKKRQEISINNQKSSYWASKLLKQSLFGNHPYGHLISFEDVDSITQKNIQEHWEKYSFENIEFVTITGNFDENIVYEHLDELLQTKNTNARGSQKIAYKPEKKVKKLEKSEQTSLKIGFPTIPLSDPDYPALSLANTLWGGYFGSRLMQTIREEKGLTYGIHSSIIHLKEASYIQVSADLKKDAGEETLILLGSEIEKMASESVNNIELEKVKSYIIGEYKSGTESIFDKMSKIKFLKTHQLEDDFFIKLYMGILQTDSEKIKAITKKHIQPNSFHTILVE